MARSVRKAAASMRCPFYRRDTPMTITCEGLVDRATIRLCFGVAEDCRIQVRTFCAGRYRNCEIYRAIMEAKYGGD